MPTTTSRIPPRVARVQPTGVAQKEVAASMSYSAARATGAVRSADSWAMVSLARAIGLVR